MSDKTIRRVNVVWQGDMRFSGAAPDGPAIPIDADNAIAPGPMQTLLIAAATCTGADVVSIIRKMQIELTRFEIAVEGERAPEHPRRYIRIQFIFRLSGPGLDEAKARRAIDLSIEKYCSVIHSLKSDIPITYQLELS
jgi:putative redox protein